MGNKQETQDARQMKGPTQTYCIVSFFYISPIFQMYLHYSERLFYSLREEIALDDSVIL